MNVNSYQTPLVAVGTLSGNLPKNPTTAGGPLPGADGAPAFGPVGLDESGAVQGVTLTPYATMQISGGVSLSPSLLSFFQEQFQQQSTTALSNQANGSTNPNT